MMLKIVHTLTYYWTFLHVKRRMILFDQRNKAIGRTMKIMRYIASGMPWIPWEWITLHLGSCSPVNGFPYICCLIIQNLYSTEAPSPSFSFSFINHNNINNWYNLFNRVGMTKSEQSSKECLATHKYYILMQDYSPSSMALYNPCFIS